MTPEEAQAWLRGDRCTVNGVDMHPVETWPERVAAADAAMLQCAYWVAKAHHEKLVVPHGPKGGDMRKVKYQSWNGRKWEEEPEPATFMAWGHESDTDGCTVMSAALELSDGRVVVRPAHVLQFIGESES